MGEGKMGMEMTANANTAVNIGAQVANSFIFNADRSAANYYQGKPDLYDMNRDIAGNNSDGAVFAIFAPAAKRIAAKANNYYNHSLTTLQRA